MAAVTTAHALTTCRGRRLVRAAEPWLHPWCNQMMFLPCTVPFLPTVSGVLGRTATVAGAAAARRR